MIYFLLTLAVILLIMASLSLVRALQEKPSIAIINGVRVTDEEWETRSILPVDADLIDEFHEAGLLLPEERELEVAQRAYLWGPKLRQRLYESEMAVRFQAYRNSLPRELRSQIVFQDGMFQVGLAHKLSRSEERILYVG